MDCNKDEAFKAKTLAENKMQNGDFVGAQKLLLKAQRLFSDLESLPQMLAVCDVHSSAEKKINGLENWYGILQVMHYSDDDTIKKQVKKLVLLLHPDKNQFAGAEAAFKLVWQANKLLTDKDKRSQYDIKHRNYSRFASNQFNANSDLQAAPANNASDNIVTNVTFWTCCQHCGNRYKYLRKYVNAHLYCSSCQRSYMAFDTGCNGVPAKSSTYQKEVRNQGACNTSVNKNVESTNSQSGNVAADMDKKGTLREKSKADDGSMKNSDESSKHTKDEEKMKNTVELQKPQPVDTEPETATSKSVCDESVSRRDQPPSVNSNTATSKSVCDESVSKRDQPPSVSINKNKRRKFVEEATESSNVVGSDIIYDKDDSKLNNRRKTQHISYAGDPLCPLKKKPRSNVKLESERTTEKIFLGVGSSNRRDSGGSVNPCAFGVAKKNVDSEYQDKSSTNGKETEGCEVPDPDFSNFELTTSCFAVNQVWSVYDPTDGMPRNYVRIEKVLYSEFKLRITWIDPLQDNKDSSIPIACGIFQDGDSDEVNDHLIFSSQMLHLHRNNNIVIYPGKGEIWAVFRGWDINWSTSSENHKRPYEYDYVEILSDFDDEFGLGVAYLGKVEGFVSLFCREVQHGILQLQIPPSEMLRFSHKASSFKMTGKEREGVPPGCFELDTAALPRDLFDVDGELDSKRPNRTTGGPFPEASKVEVQENNTLESSPSLKKRQKIHDNYTSFSKASDDRCASHEINSLKKTKKSVKVVDDLKLRKSPRLSETKKKTTSRSGKQTSEKSASNGESCGQQDGFCLLGEKVTIPKNLEKVITTDSLRVRKTPRDIQKPTGNSKKNGRIVESLSQSRGNSLLIQLNDGLKWSKSETLAPYSCKTGQENTIKFQNQRSWDKFQINQIWAIYSNDKGIPRNYVQIKLIETVPEFKLHVAPLEVYRPPNLMTHPFCCGCFKLRTSKAEVLAPSSFSHQVKAVKGKSSRFEVYPGKREIWALYRNWNTMDCVEAEEFEIVEIMETDEQRIQVMPLTAKGFNKHLYERSQESKAGSIVIPKTELCRFSHQIPSFRHERRATRFRNSGEYWELDPKAISSHIKDSNHE